jgi:hypothetical protein
MLVHGSADLEQASPAIAPATVVEAVRPPAQAPTSAAVQPRERRSALGWLADPATALIVLALVIAIGHFLYIIGDYRNLFVHPDYHQSILRQSTNGGLGFGVQDLINSFQLRSENEFRPRWLAYFIQAIDQKVRLFLYDYMPVHPTVQPLAWLLQLVVAPFCLYRLLKNLTADRLAGLAGVAVYLSSIGFLSGFTMALLQGKTLSNVVFLIALYAASVAARRLQSDQLLIESPGISKFLLWLALFVGLFVDEMPIAAFAIVPLVFWSHFLPAWSGTTRPWRARIAAFFSNGIVFMLPFVVFVVIAVVVAPIMTRYFWGYDFDYLGDTLHLGGNTRSGTSLTDGPNGSLTLGLVFENLTTLFGLSLVPWWISPLTQSRFGEYPGGQVTNLPKIAILLLFFGFAGVAAWRTHGSLGRSLQGLLIAIALFIFFLSILSIRHIPIVTGYYYGAGFAALFALLIGMLFKGSTLMLPNARPFAALAVVAIVAIQIINFAPINDGWVFMHNERGMRVLVARMRPGLQKRLPLTPPKDLSASELNSIWTAWKRDRMDDYLKDNKVSPAAIYEVFELRELDRLRDRDRDRD